MKDKIKKILGPLLKIWDGLSPKLKKILKLYFIISNALILIAIILAFIFAPTPSKDENQETDKQTSTLPIKSDSLSKVDSLRKESSAITVEDEVATTNESNKNSLNKINESAHDSLARIYLKQKRYREALFHFKQIKDSKKDDLEFMNLYSNSLYNAAEYKEFLNHFKPITTSDSAMVFRARFNLGDENSVIKSLQNLNNKTNTLRSLLAEFHIELGNIKTANGILARQLRENDFNIRALYLSARIARHKKQPKSCVQLLRRLLRYQPLYSEAYALKGLCHLDLEETLNSEINFKTAIELNPGDYNTWHNLGVLHYSLSNSFIEKDSIKKHLRLASSSFEKTLKLEDNHPSAHYHLALILSNNNQFHEAIRHQNKIPKNNPFELKSLIQKGANWEALGELDSSYHSYHKAFLLAPLNPLIQKEIIRIEKKLNK